MTKIRALYINEMIKTSKKISIVVMSLIMIIGTIGFGGLMKIQEETGNEYSYYEEDKTWMQEETQRVISDFESEIEDMRKQLADIDREADPLTYESLQDAIAGNQDYIEIHELALEQNIMLMFENNYLTDTLNKTVSIKEQIRQLEKLEDQDSKTELARQQDLLVQYQNLIDTRNFESYISLEKEAIESDPNYSESDKQIETARLDLWYKIDPSGGVENNNDSHQVQQVLEQFSQYKRSLADGLDYTNMGNVVPLTPARQNDIENELAALIYRIDNDMLDQDSDYSLSATALNGMASFGITMILLMILILAGGAISQEIATGSIKSLIIAPVKRWKIFLAKLFSLLTVGLTALIAHFAITFVFYGIFFGFDTLPSYVYATNGQAQSMTPVLYLFAGQAARFIEVIIFMAFALMLSVLTRNTAASVGISMASYFGSSLAREIILFLPAADWIRFLPFDHLNLTTKFFPFAEQNFYGMVNQNETSLLFSLIYIIVALFCMLYIALDSFNRRDIK